MGEYLGELENVPILDAAVNSMDFTGMSFDTALRQSPPFLIDSTFRTFLSRFRLPGEAQKIDRIVEKFAQKYCQCNPEVFENSDTAYILGFSLIMLNTGDTFESYRHTIP